MNQPPLFGTQVPAFTREIDKLSKLGFGVARGMFRRRLQTEQTDSARTGPVEGPDGPLKHSVKCKHGQRGRHRDSFSQCETDQLGRLFAQHNVERSDNCERYGKGESMSPRFGKPGQWGLQHPRDNRLAHPAES